MQWKADLIELILNHLHNDPTMSASFCTITEPYDHIIGHLDMLVYSELIEKRAESPDCLPITPETLIGRYQLSGKGQEYMRYMQQRR